jgi:hypothetical protein
VFRSERGRTRSNWRRRSSPSSARSRSRYFPPATWNGRRPCSRRSATRGARSTRQLFLRQGAKAEPAIARVLASLARLASPVLATFTLPTAGIMRFAPGVTHFFRRGQYDGGGSLKSKKPDALSINSEFPSHGARSVLGFQIEAGRLCAVSGRDAGDLNVTAEEARIAETIVVESPRPRTISTGEIRRPAGFFDSNRP